MMSSRVLVRSDNTLTFPQNWPCGQALVNQVNLIAEDYRRFYNTNYGPEINSRTSLDLGMTPEQATLRNFLINNWSRQRQANHFSGHPTAYLDT